MLDERVVALAKRVHHVVVPTICLHETVPEASASIWIMGKMPGTMVIQLSAREELSTVKQSRAVSGLARFFADAWACPQPARHEWTAETERQLSQLEAQLPSQLQKWARSSREALPDIIKLPWVLTHSNLSDANILLDPQSGELAGVVDWGCAFISPFGRALWGVESLLGEWNQDGFVFMHNDNAEARRLFAGVFRTSVATELSSATCRTIEASGILGLLLRHGYQWSPGGMKVINEDTEGGARIVTPYKSYCKQSSSDMKDH